MTSIRRLRMIGPALAVALAAGLVTGPAAHATSASAPAAPSANCRLSDDPGRDASLVRLDTMEQEALNLINNFRAQNGVPPLVANGRLLRPAAWASHDDAVRGLAPSNHVDSLGRGIPTRFQQCGVTGFGRIAEINYFGTGSSGTGAAALRWWTEVSPKLGLTHRNILLDPNLRVVGVGRAARAGTVYWTVTFADRVS